MDNFICSFYDIPDKIKSTYYSENFKTYDSVQSNKNRIIIFSMETHILPLEKSNF